MNVSNFTTRFSTITQRNSETPFQNFLASSQSCFAQPSSHQSAQRRAQCITHRVQFDNSALSASIIVGYMSMVSFVVRKVWISCATTPCVADHVRCEGRWNVHVPYTLYRVSVEARNASGTNVCAHPFVCGVSHPASWCRRWRVTSDQVWCCFGVPHPRQESVIRIINSSKQLFWGATPETGIRHTHHEYYQTTPNLSDRVRRASVDTYSPEAILYTQTGCTNIPAPIRIINASKQLQTCLIACDAQASTPIRRRRYSTHKRGARTFQHPYAS